MTDKLWRKLCSELQIQGWKEGQMCEKQWIFAQKFNSQGQDKYQCDRCQFATDFENQEGRRTIKRPHEIPPSDQTDKAVLWEVFEQLMKRDHRVEGHIGEFRIDNGKWEPDLLTAAAKALGIEE